MLSVVLLMKLVGPDEGMENGASGTPLAEDFSGLCLVPKVAASRILPWELGLGPAFLADFCTDEMLCGLHSLSCFDPSSLSSALHLCPCSCPLPSVPK